MFFLNLLKQVLSNKKKLMKTYSLKSVITLLLLLFLAHGSFAQRFVIKVRPTPPAAVRIAAPSARHIWIDGDWVWSGGTYVYKPGYWYLPRGRERWVPGHWVRARGGWAWIPGHWKYRRW